jgi:predicted Ser/Thr protein kinase
MEGTMALVTELLNDRYRLGELIAHGGMSDVYRGLDIRADTPVAIKIVRSEDPEMARRLAQEAKALERFTHPGLVRLLDTGALGTRVYLVMEYVDGPNVASVIRGGALTPARTALIGATVAEALAYVHERGIVHRDVKPANILLDPSGLPKLSDFGVARLTDTTALTITGTTLGTASYMAPEQLERHDVGPEADVWSLGMVLFECLIGKRVYEGTPGEVIAQRLAGPLPLGSELPVTWRLVLAGLLDHQPDRRPSASEAAGLLRAPVLAEPWGDPVPAPGVDLVPTKLLGRTARSPGAPTVAARGATAVLAPNRAPRRRASGARRRGIALGLGLGGALAAAVLALTLLGSTPRPATAPHRTSVTTVRHGPTGTAHTVSAPTPAQAVAGFAQTLNSAAAAGSLPPSEAQFLAAKAQEALTDLQAGNTDQATYSLQAAAVALVNGVQDGSIASAEASVLQSDLNSLAAALGLPGAGNPPVTSVGGNGQGNGHGNGPGKETG